MLEQLSLFDFESTVDKVRENLSLSDFDSDAKIEAIQRFCRFKNNEAIACVNIYSPGHRETKYYRLSWRNGKRMKHYHIPGGNINSELAVTRAKKIQQMIDRGAELEEIIAAIKTYRGTKPTK